MTEAGLQVAAAKTSDSSLVSFQLLTDLREIEEITPEWEALLQLSICNRAFGSPAWFIAAYQAQPETPLHVVVARRNGILAGVFPLVVNTPVLNTLVVNTKTCLAEFATVWNDYNDMITATGDTEVMCGLLHYALTQSTACDKLALQRLRYDSNCFRALRSVFSESHLEKCFLEEPTQYTYVPLSSSYQEYLGSLKSKFRKNLLSLKRKAQATISVRELHPSSFSPELLPETFLSVHLARFGTRTSFADAIDQAFVRYLLPRLFSNGSLRVFALFQKESIVALALCMVGPDSLCLWNGGFLPEMEPWSPGALLIDAGLHSACDSGLAEYDFIRGTEAYKKKWASNFRVVGSIELPTGQGTLCDTAL
jgi:CelD/BcsL family acetyltransferase involved in cellulose biosynthesis